MTNPPLPLWSTRDENPMQLYAVHAYQDGVITAAAVVIARNNRSAVGKVQKAVEVGAGETTWEWVRLRTLEHDTRSGVWVLWPLDQPLQPLG